jgi:hypothetical protein
MMTGLHTRALTSSPFLQGSGHPSGAPEGREKAGHVQVLRDPYEWKSAVSLALAVFVASLALAPALARDQKKFAAEINTKTLKAAAAIKSSTRLPLRVQNGQENEQRRGAEDTRPKFSRFAKLRFS